MNREQIKELVLQHVEPNQTEESKILGAMDSIDLVTLIMDVEDNLRQNGYIVKLVSDKAFSTHSSPFRTVGTLVDHIEDIITEELRYEDNGNHGS